MLHEINSKSDIAEKKSRELKGLAIDIIQKETEKKKWKEYQLDKFNQMNIHDMGIPNKGRGRKNIFKNNG